jgi:hypothetical protein
VLQLRHVLLSSTFLGESPGQHELGFKDRCFLLNKAVQGGAHPIVPTVAHKPLHRA